MLNQSNLIVIFSCAGRTGNQLEHFLGGLAFAKSVNRTLVLPPFRTYRNVRFTEWFKFQPLTEFHRVVLAEDFMQYLAPEHWPPGQRIGFCWHPVTSNKKECHMKTGNPFGPFWDGFNIDFDQEQPYHISYYDSDISKWNDLYPVSRYPVLAMRGAPAPFPMIAADRPLQKYLVFSDRIREEADKYIEDHFSGQKFVGIHLRNGVDWENACVSAEGKSNYMASPQCMEDHPGMTLTKKINPTVISICLFYICLSFLLRLTRNKVIETKAQVVFVATDKLPFVSEIEDNLKDRNVRVFHADPWLPIIDMAILIESDHFIGNCISSFTSFVKRARDVQSKPSSFWGIS
ncbi:hypothetical protein CAPTEDRAFT_1241 [Capitella teleta]|uniref:GDP-fucose protein O-fucosyltransferase 1 n=1 Tax=Capitella teleta TaxID=283909 RepID=X1YYJ1_CAPTE|nr:hypothetical protein CAPTEDRAFT_1241 [Capitella teleta]|eukprot:ELT90125.1 hypothetical protein CAPTEDRAFT_1241 [Capitella teleta]